MPAALPEQLTALLSKVSFEVTAPDHETVRSVATLVVDRRCGKGVATRPCWRTLPGEGPRTSVLRTGTHPVPVQQQSRRVGRNAAGSVTGPPFPPRWFYPGMVDAAQELLRLTPVYEEVEGGWTQARLVELPGVITAAPTRDQAHDMLLDALREFILSFGPAPAAPSASGHADELMLTISVGSAPTP